MVPVSTARLSDSPVKSKPIQWLSYEIKLPDTTFLYHADKDLKYVCIFLY